MMMSPLQAGSAVTEQYGDELQLAERGLRSEGPQPFFVDLSGKWITAERFDKDVKEALRRYAVAHELHLESLLNQSGPRI
eukprot:scaffold189_cov249-Pinguiococcus_pyrenoidosus.AAC.1